MKNLRKPAKKLTGFLICGKPVNYSSYLEPAKGSVMISQYYTSIMKTELASEVFERAKAFARKVTSTTDYTDSNQTKKEKISDDHYISKLGEEAVKKVLSQFALVTGPDYQIYIASNKSWQDDLFIDGQGIAVKTQKRSSAQLYGLSWTFQAGPTRRDKVLDRPDAWVAFVVYDDIEKHAFYVYPLMQIKQLKFDEPVLPHLKGHKVVVYANSLPKGAK
jgi:hypothetical protein